MAIEPGDFGWVHAIDGEHVGRVGFYDDDDDEDDIDRAIVYFGAWCDGYNFVPYEELATCEDAGCDREHSETRLWPYHEDKRPAGVKRPSNGLELALAVFGKP